MELPRLDLSEPALLVLGRRDASFGDLARLCQAASIRVDRADTLQSALEVFLRRGGHDAVLCHGTLRDAADTQTVLGKLQAIDAGVEVWDLARVRALTQNA